MSKVIITFLILFSVSCYSMEISWEESVSLVVENNPRLRSAFNNFESRQFNEKVQLADFLPQLSASLGYSRTRDVRGDSVGETDEQYSASLRLSQSLFSGLGDQASFREAKYQTKSSLSSLDDLKSELSSLLIRRFENLNFARDFIELTEEIIERRRENVNLLELRFESGQEDKGALMLSQANLKQAEFNYTQTKDLLRTAQVQFLEILGLSSHEEITLIDQYPVSESISEIPNFRELALKVPETKQAKYQKKASRQGVRVANAAHLPSLSLESTLNSTDDRFFPDDRGRFSVGLNLNIPIFSGGRDYYRSQIAVNEWVSASEDYRQQSLGMHSRLEESYWEYSQAFELVKIEEKFREASKLRAEIARAKYSNGLLSFEDWDRIENDYIQRQQSYLRAKRDLVFAEAQWLRAQGKHLF